LNLPLSQPAKASAPASSSAKERSVAGEKGKKKERFGSTAVGE